MRWNSYLGESKWINKSRRRNSVLAPDVLNKLQCCHKVYIGKQWIFVKGCECFRVVLWQWTTLCWERWLWSKGTGLRLVDYRAACSVFGEMIKSPTTVIFNVQVVLIMNCDTLHGAPVTNTQHCQFIPIKDVHFQSRRGASFYFFCMNVHRNPEKHIWLHLIWTTGFKRIFFFFFTSRIHPALFFLALACHISTEQPGPFSSCI